MILLGIPLETIYAEENCEGIRTIFKRGHILASVIDFIENNTMLTGLTFLTDLNGCSFICLSGLHQSRIEDFKFLIVTFQPPTDKLVIEHIKESEDFLSY